MFSEIALPKNIIIEGIDRTSKNSTISAFLNTCGFYQLIHYSKPLSLKAFDGSLKAFQQESFRHMFKMLKAGGFILNRSHLGEAVYAQRYRGYSGDYVFELENYYKDHLNGTTLILLTADNFNAMTDDGNSFDWNAKEAEQEDFKKAFERSIIKNKFQVNVTNESGYRSRIEILQEILTNLGLKNKVEESDIPTWVV